MPDEDQPNSLNLSQALLAPLNAIFEAQIHSARTFLSFILQMGFRHIYSKGDKKMNEDIVNNSQDPLAVEEAKAILDEIQDQDDAKKEIARIRERITELSEKETSNTLSVEENAELDQLKGDLRSLLSKHGDLWTQSFQYVDDEGNEREIIIPNLALIPVKPLAVEDANFQFEMRVDSSDQDYNTLRSSAGGEVDRPWFLIKPRRVMGTIVPSESSEKSAGIKIEINVKSAPMPQGLSTLLISLTQTAKVVDKESGND